MSLASDANIRGHHDQAIACLLQVLAAEPHNEAAHLVLVTTASNARHHGEARRYYSIYTRRMEAIGAPPAAFPGRGRTI